MKNKIKQDIKDLQQIVSDNSSAIGQKADKTQISNPNLLINGDFQVWQRGTSFGVPNGFQLTADRWRVNNEGLPQNIIVNKEDFNFKFTIQDNTPTSSNIAYYFEKDFITRLVGKVLTLSLEYKNEYSDNFFDDVSFFTENDVPSYDILSTKKINLDNGWIKKIVTFRINSISTNSNSVHIQILRGNRDIFGYHLIKYVKLELGDIATPFSPRSYAEELAMCQRYSLVSGVDDYITAFCVSVTSNELFFELPIQQRFRIMPSIINPNTGFTIRDLQSGIATGFTFSIVRITSLSILIKAVKTSHGITTNNHFLSIEPTGGFDAEIY